MKDILFKLKYRPKNLEDVILLPRIRKAIENGITDHLLLYGSFGMGKNALIDVLMKDKNCLYLNTSKETSVEILRNQIEKHCSTMDMFGSKDDMKYVFFDEIDGASKTYQEALKAFIERNEMKVRFIATTNYVNRLEGGLLDRFRPLNFSPLNNEEEKYLKVNYAKRVKQISDVEGIKLEVNDIKNIINKNFPSFRRILSTLQYIKETGVVEVHSGSLDSELKEELYNHIFSESWDTEKCYDFLLSNFGAEAMDDLIKLLSRPFIEWVAIKDRTLISKLGDVLTQVTKYSDILQRNNVLDPLIVGITLIHNVRLELFK